MTATANQQAIRAPILWPVPRIAPTYCVDELTQVSDGRQLEYEARWEVLEVQGGIGGIGDAGCVVGGGSTAGGLRGHRSSRPDSGRSSLEVLGGL